MWHSRLGCDFPCAINRAYFLHEVTSAVNHRRDACATFFVSSYATRSQAPLGNAVFEALLRRCWELLPVNQGRLRTRVVTSRAKFPNSPLLFGAELRGLHSQAELLSLPTCFLS